MKLTVAEAVDKYTVLKLKQEHDLNVEIPLELIDLAGQVEETSTLYEINHIMWEIEDKITEEMKAEKVDVAKIGMHAIYLRTFTKLRVETKNQIAVKYDEPTEQKNY